MWARDWLVRASEMWTGCEVAERARDRVYVYQILTHTRGPRAIDLSMTMCPRIALSAERLDTARRVTRSPDRGQRSAGSLTPHVNIAPARQSWKPATTRAPRSEESHISFCRRVESVIAHMSIDATRTLSQHTHRAYTRTSNQTPREAPPAQIDLHTHRLVLPLIWFAHPHTH